MGSYTPSLTLWQGWGGAERPPRDNQRLPDLGVEGVKVIEMQYQAAGKAMGGSHSYSQRERERERDFNDGDITQAQIQSDNTTMQV